MSDGMFTVPIVTDTGLVLGWGRGGHIVHGAAYHKERGTDLRFLRYANGEVAELSQEEKDAILAQAWHTHNYLIFAVAALVAVLTTFYMFRLFFVALVGEPRTHEAGHAHESPGVMIWPLRILAVFAIIGGVIGSLIYKSVWPAV